VHFLNLLEGDEGERYRWLFAIRGVDELLTDFGLSLPEKTTLTEQIYHSFFQEFNGDSGLTRQLDDKYRTVSRELTSFLDPANDTPYIQDAVDVFAARSVAIREAYIAWQATLEPQYLVANSSAMMRRLLPSYLHMFLNRIFLANQRLHELVVYHYLGKHYKSVAARQKQLSLVEA
jgi:thiopeptide-type bacteriocin biosynthesis protein